MANNELSGPVVLSEIISYLKSIPHRKYTYRFVLLPETIGSIAYLSANLDTLQANMIAGFNLSCCGDTNSYTHIQSKTATTLADSALTAALFHKNNVKVRSFAHRGSDERQYNSVGVDLPVCGFSRTKYGEYPEYHTSLDNLDYISPEGLDGSYIVLKSIIDAFECSLYPKTQVLCEPQLGKRGLYPTLSFCKSSLLTERQIDDVTVRMDVLAYADGTNSIFDLVRYSESSLPQVIDEVRLLTSHGLLS